MNEMSGKNAIITQKLCFSYQSGVNKKPILNCVDMNVPQGVIYGLLGPSGCGKTSLLKVILGFLKPDAGNVSVFSYEPGSSQSDIPGVSVGFMPQQIGLQEYLKVKEVFYYFGSIYFRSNHIIDKCMKRFLKLLNLNDENAIVWTLSGGQKRRLSLAVAAFTEPRLLILDEPTVGVDPLLCKTIWEFLKEISSKKRITIIVTTHYIEEMKLAQKVAFMRDGEIIIEGTPNYLLAQFGRNRLEDVFYDLSYNQTRQKSSVLTTNDVRRMSQKMAGYESIRFKHKKINSKQNCVTKNILITLTLIWENFIKYYRHSAFMLILLLPMFVAFVASVAVGTIPDENQMGWVVEDSFNSHIGSLLNLTAKPEFENNDANPYLPELLHAQFNKSIIKLINYENLTKALEDVNSSKIRGVVYLPANFSSAFYERDFYLSGHGEWVENATIEAGGIRIWLDGNNPLLSNIMIYAVYKKVQLFREKAYEAIGLHKNVSLLPVQIMKDINGMNDGDYLRISKFTTLGIFIVFIFGASLLVTSINVHIGNSEELFIRCYTAGVRSHQTIFALTVVNFLILAFSAIISLFFIIVVLNVACNGYLIYAVICITLVSLSGVSSGLLLSVSISSTTFCTVFSSGYTFILYVISGSLWPIEALPYFIKGIAFILPIAIPTSAIRRIFDYENVDFETYILPGLLVSVGHTLLCSTISCFVLKKKQ